MDLSSNNIHNILNLYEYTSHLKMDSNRNTLVKLLAERFEDLIQEIDFFEFDLHQIKELLSEDQIGTRSYISAKSVDMETYFSQFRPRPRQLLLKEKPFILWDTPSTAYNPMADTQVEVNSYQYFLKDL
ncbi:hypothetical protein JTE90_001536 [Oedothorax gibbosus]|uniref:Uncharacterized protein n=1 Tax=Oedothorax gibbosus TaxID=931172 RepID=A0AAV6TP18_9ARAC|nr:hypothetical protein JTE90_001536 [Oedothorax gibbosus]